MKKHRDCVTSQSRHLKLSTAAPPSLWHLCPLYLLSTDPGLRGRVLEAILHDTDEAPPPHSHQPAPPPAASLLQGGPPVAASPGDGRRTRHRSRSRDRGPVAVAIHRWLLSPAAEHLFSTLRDLQLIFDPRGPLHATPHDDDLATAMTLRDCTVFLRVRVRDGEGAVEDGGGDGVGDDGDAQVVEVKLADFDKKRVETKYETWKEAEEELQKYYGGARDEYVQLPGTICYLEATAT